MDYKQYLLSEHWRQTKIRKKQSVGYQCEQCGNRRFLEVHHLTYKTLWKENIYTDLQCLCASCHDTKHFTNWQKIEEELESIF